MASRTYAIALIEGEIHKRLDELHKLGLADCITRTKYRQKFFPTISQTRFNEICKDWENK